MARDHPDEAAGIVPYGSGDVEHPRRVGGIAVRPQAGEQRGVVHVAHEGAVAAPDEVLPMRHVDPLERAGAGHRDPPSAPISPMMA